MAVSTLSDYFGTTLATYITANASTIGTNLGVSSTAVTNPDGLLAAIIVRAKAWLEADGTEANGTSVTGFGTDGAPSKITGSGDREYQLGYQYQVTFWIPDTTSNEVDPTKVY